MPPPLAEPDGRLVVLPLELLATTATPCMDVSTSCCVIFISVIACI
jgi:hypothetical protein